MTKEGKYGKKETERLIKLYHEGKSIEEICKALERERKSVLNKIYHLGLRRKGFVWDSREMSKE